MWFLVVGVCLTSCNKNEGGPAFKSVLEIDLGNISKKNSKFSCYVVFTNNDDKASFKVKQLVADLKINGKDAGTPLTDEAIEVLPHSEFKVPVHFEIHPDDFITVAEGENYPESLPVKLEGTLTLTDANGKEVKVDFSHEESVVINIKKEERQEEKEAKKEERKAKRELKKKEKEEH